MGASQTKISKLLRRSMTYSDSCRTELCVHLHSKHFGSLKAERWPCQGSPFNPNRIETIAIHDDGHVLIIDLVIGILDYQPAHLRKKRFCSLPMTMLQPIPIGAFSRRKQHPTPRMNTAITSPAW